METKLLILKLPQIAPVQRFQYLPKGEHLMSTLELFAEFLNDGLSEGGANLQAFVERGNLVLESNGARAVLDVSMPIDVDAPQLNPDCLTTFLSDSLSQLGAYVNFADPCGQTISVIDRNGKTVWLGLE